MPFYNSIMSKLQTESIFIRNCKYEKHFKKGRYSREYVGLIVYEKDDPNTVSQYVMTESLNTDTSRGWNIVSKEEFYTHLCEKGTITTEEKILEML